MRKHLGAIGGALTVIYLAIMVALVWSRSGTLLTMPLNEVGDFLAGAFGPVAFMWLVLGFLQQGEELRQGTEALLLQATELKNSVEQQSIMATAATLQIEAQREALQHQFDEKDRALRAYLVIDRLSRTTIGDGEITFVVSVKNTASNAYQAFAAFDPPLWESGGDYKGSLGDIPKHESSEFSVKFDPDAVQQEGVMTLTYCDAEGNRRQEYFKYFIRNRWLEVDKQEPTRKGKEGAASAAPAEAAHQ